MFERGLAEFALYGNRIVLLVLVLASVINVGLFIERRRFFHRHLLRDAHGLGERILRASSLAQVQSELSAAPSLETQLVVAGLDGADTTPEFEKRVEGRTALARVQWERFTGVFAWTSSNGPLAGLLGTVLGLMKAFSDLAVAAIPEPRVALAGISDALLTTVLGIVVAIPATAFYNYCKLRGRKASAGVNALTALIASRNLFPSDSRGNAES